GAGILVLAALLLVPVFGAAYGPAILPLPLLLLGYVVLSGREIAVLWYVHEQKSYAVPVRASAVAFAVSLAAPLPLAWRFGLVGAGGGAVAGGLVLMAILLAGLRRRGLAPRSLLAVDPELLEPVAAAVRRLGRRGVPSTGRSRS